MSDTTITAEERAEWRERLTSKFSCFDAELSGFTLRLLNVLEITEGMLDGSVQETRANFSAVYQACTEIIPDLKAKLAVAEARAEKAEAMVDWLAVRCAIHCRDKWPGSVECNVEDCTIGPCIRASSDKWAEAARRAVADADSEVK